MICILFLIVLVENGIKQWYYKGEENLTRGIVAVSAKHDCR